MNIHLVAALLSSFAAHSFQFSPIYATLKPKGREKSFTFAAANPNTEKAAVQITMYNRVEDIDGNEKNTPADDKFNIYPQQFVLKPKEVKRVRVTWLGEESPTQELAFRLEAAQLPVEDLNDSKKKAQGGQIKILMKYVASVYVEPDGVDSDIQVKSAEIVPQGKGHRLHLVFENKGMKHRLLDEPKLKITFTAKGEEKTIELETKQLEALKEKNVLPGQERQFFIPWEQPKPEGPIKVELSLKAPL